MTERVASMSSIPKRIKCLHPRCKRWAKLGLSVSLDTFVRNRIMSDKTRRDLRYVFGKKKASRIRTTGDVDSCLYDFQSRYKHLMPNYKRGRTYDLNSKADREDLGLPSFKLADPFPDAPISDDRNNNPEVRER